MGNRIKIVFAYIGLFILFSILLISTCYKYFVKDELSKYKTSTVINEKTNNKNNIRNIKNMDDIIMNDFSLTELKINFDDENQVITIIGNINNLTNKEKQYKILSSIYNENKSLIHSKQISTDNKIQANDTIPFFINHYYDEFNTNKDEIKFYNIEIKE